jgi:hypothetical protein
MEKLGVLVGRQCIANSGEVARRLPAEAMWDLLLKLMDLSTVSVTSIGSDNLGLSVENIKGAYSVFLRAHCLASHLSYIRLFWSAEEKCVASFRLRLEVKTSMGFVKGHADALANLLKIHDIPDDFVFGDNIISIGMIKTWAMFTAGPLVGDMCAFFTLSLLRSLEKEMLDLTNMCPKYHHIVSDSIFLKPSCKKCLAQWQGRQRLSERSLALMTAMTNATADYKVISKGEVTLESFAPDSIALLRSGWKEIKACVAVLAAMNIIFNLESTQQFDEARQFVDHKNALPLMLQKEIDLIVSSGDPKRRRKA